MTTNGVIQFVAYFVILLLVTKPLGIYMANVFEGKRTMLTRILGPIERALYLLIGVDAEKEMSWKQYSMAMLMFSLASVVLVYAIERLQGVLPLNPAGLPGVAPALAFNTAVSFATNTNWQAYVPETTMSYLTQMAALTVQNFASAAVGIAIAIALVRGLTRSGANGLGNFWADLVRCTLYLLLPLSILIAFFFVSQGVIQNFSPNQVITTLEGAKQTLPMGPIASQEAIKMLGTNGGGFLNANSAHPFENPTPLTSFIQTLLIFLIPAGLTYTFGRMAKDQKQGWALFGAMSFLFIASFFVTYGAESAGNPIVAGLGGQIAASETQSGGNMEGKEVRFGIAHTALFATATTDASCGAVNGMHDSFTPIGGMMVMFNIMLGEIVFGGTGSGLYGMLIFVLLSVFIAGLMVGRTPEYLGKKIEAREVKLAMLGLLAMVFSILGFSAWGAINPNALSSLANKGPHGLSELLYTFTSATGNNGSAFAGINANTDFLNITTGLAMLAGRYLMILPMLAVAGALVKKTAVPPSPGTFLTNTPLFGALLVMVILIVGGLTFFPALALGPILEQLLMQAGKVF